MTRASLSGRSGWGLGLALAGVLIGLSACWAAPGVQTGTAATGVLRTLPGQGSGLSPTATPAALVPPVPGLAAGLPGAFRYEMKLLPAAGGGAESGSEAIVITGRYRAGSWQQAGGSQADGSGGASVQADPRTVQEVIVDGGAMYTRAGGETGWVRAAGVAFDAAFGLASPFAPLRLYPWAKAEGRRLLAPVSGAPEATFRNETVVSGQAIAGMFQSGAEAIGQDASALAALAQQAASLAISQTITYWASAEGRVYRAESTLMAADEAGRASPWLSATWRFWAYDDPGIVVSQPTVFRAEAAAEAPSGTPAAAAASGIAGAPSGVSPTAGSAIPGSASLGVRVFASAGAPAAGAIVSVYAAGARAANPAQPVAEHEGAQAQFTLAPGRYDVLVQLEYSQQWLEGLQAAAGQPVVRDVTFTFGTLRLTVLSGGKPAAVEIVTYPAGERQNWVDWRSDNPAAIQLLAGNYDIEIAYADYSQRQVFTGVAIKAGETTVRTLQLGR